MTNDTLNTVQALARRCLWIAYCWNDHNFDAAYGYARETAKAHGINSLEDANALIEQIEQMRSEDSRRPPFAVDILGNPMREYEPGKWEVAQWPSEASDRGIQPDGHATAASSAAPTPPPTELQRIHAVVMHVAGDWPDDVRDPYTLRHVKWMARELNKRSAEHAQLLKFYGVTTLTALVDAQSHHIEKLQAKLPATPSLAPQQVREG